MTGIERRQSHRDLLIMDRSAIPELPRYYYDIDCKPDVAMIQVAPMDVHGFLTSDRVHRI